MVVSTGRNYVIYFFGNITLIVIAVSKKLVEICHVFQGFFMHLYSTNFLSH